MTEQAVYYIGALSIALHFGRMVFAMIDYIEKH